MRYDRAGELEQQLREDTEKLLEQADASDREDRPDDQELPQELARRERLREKMLEARRQLEERARSHRRFRRTPSRSTWTTPTARHLENCRRENARQPTVQESGNRSTRVLTRLKYFFISAQEKASILPLLPLSEGFRRTSRT